jgi:hypothetical protein
VLVLVVSDAVAALVGSRFGRVLYEVDEGEKSLEGSLAFLGTAYVAIAGVLLGMTDLPPANCALAALLVALLATQMEAIALGGADNLFLPILVCVVLAKVTSRPLSGIVLQNAAFMTITLAIAGTAIVTRLFNVGATLALSMFAYGCWALGSPTWAMPVFSGFVFYVACRMMAPLPPGENAGLRVRALARALLLPFAALAFANFRSLHAHFFGPFLAAGTAVVTFALWNHFLRVRPSQGIVRRVRALALCAVTWAVVVLPPCAVLRWQPFPSALALGGVALVLAAVNDVLVGPEPSFDFRNRTWPASSYVLTLAAAALTAALQALQVVLPWPL